MPPSPRDERGAPRTIGFEFEFAGLTVARTAAVLGELLEASPVPQSAFRSVIPTERYGEFAVEMDAALLKEKEYERLLRRLGFRLDADELLRMERFMADVSALVVPCEVITPPLTLEQSGVAEAVRAALHKAGTKGSGASPLFAFGFQINVRPPSLAVDGLLAHLRAFLLLYDWLAVESGDDLTRRLSPYVNEFPNGYAQLVLDPDYRPASLDRFVRDYLTANPTRNRPLDLLPLFAFLAPDLVARAPVEHHLVKARPTFHYRLPTCRIDEPAWTVTREWNLWLEVEKLAADSDRLARMTHAWRKSREIPANLLDPPWVEQTRDWL